MKYLDNSTAPDDRRVILYQETGAFETLTTGPSRASSTIIGVAITFVVDPETSDVLDYGNFNVGERGFTPLKGVKGAKTLFER